MTNELQSGDLTADDIEQPLETENLQDEGAELAADSETQHEEKAEAESEVNQEAIQKVINKKHFEKMEAERKAQDLQKQLKEYQRKEQEKQASMYNSLPEKPDPFDDNYDEKQAQYEEALTKKAAFDAQQQFLQQQTLQQQQLEQAKKHQELQTKAKTYEDRAKEFGISKDEVMVTGQSLINAGISESLAEALLEDAEGPLVAKYLSANPSELDALQGNPYLAGARMVEIKEKAKALKPKETNAPTPPTRVEGKAVDIDINKYQHVQGNFE